MEEIREEEEGGNGRNKRAMGVDVADVLHRKQTTDGNGDEAVYGVIETVVEREGWGKFVL